MATQFIPAKLTSGNIPMLTTNAVGAIAGLIFAVGFWFVGAASTVVFASVVVPALTGLSVAIGVWYGLAVLMSVIEIWDARTPDDSSWLKQLARSVRRIDMTTTMVGLYIIATKNFLPQFATLIANIGIVVVWTNPYVVTGWYISVIVISVLFGRWITLRPELIMIEATTQLWLVCKYVFKALRGEFIEITVEDAKGVK
jgi:hypothetical protein